MVYHLGVVPYRVGLKAVLLKDGEFFKKMELIVPLRHDQKFDRGLHLNEAAAYIDDLHHQYKDISGTCIDSVDYDSGIKNIVDRSQAIGAILSLPYKAHAVSTHTWRTALIGRGGVTQRDVQREIDDRFKLQDEFEGDADWYTAFCLGRFGYIKDQPDPGA